MSLSNEDLEHRRALRISRFLANRGDPNNATLLTHPLPVYCGTPPSGPNATPSHNYSNITTSRQHHSDLPPHSTRIDCPVTILQKCALLEDATLTKQVYASALRPIAPCAVAEPHGFPSPLMCAVLPKEATEMATLGEGERTAEWEERAPLLKWCRSLGSWGVVESLLMKRVPLDEATTGDGISPLVVALLVGNGRTVKALLDGGALRHTSPKLALYSAALSYRPDSLLELVKAEPHRIAAAACAGSLDGLGQTALHVLVTAPPRLQLVEEPEDGQDLLQDQLQFARALLSIGVPVNAANVEGDTALHVAWRYGSVALARLLVDEGRADLLARNAFGDIPLVGHPLSRSALSVALYGGTAGILSGSGALSSSGVALWLCSLLHRRPPTTASLVTEFEAQPMMIPWDLTAVSAYDLQNSLHLLCNDSKWTGLFHARFGGSLPEHPSSESPGTFLLTALLDVAATALGGRSASAYDQFVNAKDAMERTPLFLAVENNLPLIVVRRLLEAGADPTIVCGKRTESAARTHCPRTVLQHLASLTDPPVHVSATALLLLDHMLLARGVELHSQPTHPNESWPLKSILTVETVQSHPYWQAFRDVYTPAVDAKEERHREAAHYAAYVQNEVEVPPSSIRDRGVALAVPHTVGGGESAPPTSCEGEERLLWIGSVASSVTPPPIVPFTVTMQAELEDAMSRSHRGGGASSHRPSGEEEEQGPRSVIAVRRQPPLQPSSAHEESSFLQRLKNVEDQLASSQLSAQRYEWEHEQQETPSSSMLQRPHRVPEEGEEEDEDSSPVDWQRILQRIPSRVVRSFLLTQELGRVRILERKGSAAVQWDAVLRFRHQQRLEALRHAELPEKGEQVHLACIRAGRRII